MVFSQNVFKAGPHRFLRSSVSSPATLGCGDAEIAELVPSMATKQDTSLQESTGVVVMSKQLSIRCNCYSSSITPTKLGRSFSLRKCSYVTFVNVLNRYWPAGEVHFDMEAQKAPRLWSIGGRYASVAIRTP